MKNCTLPRRVVQQVESDYLVEEPNEEQQVLMLQSGDHKENDQLTTGSILKLAIDSGSELHVIPRRLVRKWIEHIQNGKAQAQVAAASFQENR